jgi:mono/diheme cytochrome c family protein
VAGLDKYAASCAGCHTANVAGNVLKVKDGRTAAAISSAIRNVGSMNGLSSLSNQDLLDIAAYIAKF